MSRSRTDQLFEDCAAALPAPREHLAALKGTCLLVTGGTGFVGTWVAQAVAFLNEEFGFGIQAHLMATRPESLAQTAPHLATRSDLRLWAQDIRSVVEIPADVQFVIHAAGTPDNRFHASNPVRTVETFCMGTHALLSAAARIADLRNVLHVSSGMVYGSQAPDMPPLGERMFGALDPSMPSAVYAEAKRAGESLCAAFRTQFGVPLTIARPFTFLGPFQLLDRPWAVNNFIRDALRGGAIRVQGDGETKRSFMYGADMAHWLLRILVAGRPGTAYNVGSPQAVTLKELAWKVAGMVPGRPDVQFNALPQFRAPRTAWVPDVGLAQRELGLSLACDLDHALRRTIDWHGGS